jgi:hypothetical protein
MDKHHETRASSAQELSFDQLLDSMSPREIRARIRSFAKEEEEQKRKDEHVHREKQNDSRKDREPKELTFDEALETMSPREIRARIREVAKEVKADELARQAEEQKRKDEAKLPNNGQENLRLEENLKLDQSKSDKPFHMTYDKASNSYITDDGYVLNAGPKIERLSGYMLQDELNRIAELQAKSDKSNPSLRSASKIDPLIDLPNSNLDYKTLATGVPVRSLYSNGGSACSEMSVTVDARVIGIAAGSLTIYDKQNDECRLAQTVQQACTMTELLALDVKNSSSVEEMMMKSDTVVTSSEFCAETIESVAKEKERLRREE